MFNQILRRKESGERKEPLLTASFSPLSILFFLSIPVLMFIFVACSNSPVEEDDRDKKEPDLEKILKDMALIPAGEFLMGSPEDEGAFDEHPQHVVYLDDYYIDKYEVTNAQFKEFVEATGYVTDAERKGYGEVWNPKEYSAMRLRNFASVNWRSPNTWRTIDDKLHPEAWENYQLADKMEYKKYLDKNA
jgi:formylglycine-generating enzyme required for sulfatase activity